VWGINKYDDIQDNSVAKLVSNLRKKLDTVSPGAGVRHIQTVHGRGVKCLPA
jgi:DNA-binding response OmpR family regulator